jgi:ribosomal protein S18 acetylase RimI-like enzyme
MWRLANASDDEAIVAMCIALNAEDPGPEPVTAEQVRRTLALLREQPSRGCAVLCIAGGDVAGYALLISFWSNELGGEVCNIDELFVVHGHRGHGIATALISGLARGGEPFWPVRPVALALEVSPQNERAVGLYRRLGFAGENLSLTRRLPPAD